MKNLLKTIATLVLCVPFNVNAQNQIYFAAYPALTPDVQTIVFSYDDDIWKVPVKEGLASRITAMQVKKLIQKYLLMVNR